MQPPKPSRTPDYLTGATISPDKVAWMEHHLPSQPGRALDLGCGAGLYSTWLVDRGWKVTAVDVAPAPIPRVETLRQDLENGLPFPAASFDAVLAWDILEHLAMDGPMWRDMARILAPGGYLIGSVPHDGDVRLRPYNLVFKHHLDRTHQREYTAAMLRERVLTAGLVEGVIEPKGPASPKVLVEFIRWKPARHPVGWILGALRRAGLLQFGELYADLFFTAKKPA